MADKLTGFDRKINELQEKRAQLDLSFLQGQKQEFERRIAELLESPTDGNESEREALSKFNEVRECHAKIKDINNKIEHIPENAGELIEEIDRKLSFYKEKREETNKIPLYKDTEEGIAEIFGSDILQYARETNNIELINKLKTRSLTPRKYSRLLKEDYAKYKHEKMEKMYTELFTLEKSKPLENGNSSEQKNPSEGCNQEDDEQSPRKRRKIENPKDTLSKLDIGYQTVDGVILPTKGNIQTIRRSKAVLQNYTELDQEYEDKINILFSKVLTPENGFDSSDYNVITGMEPKHMVRRTTYVIVELPQKNKMIILNNGYGEASFLCDEMFKKSLLTSVSKEELVKQHGENIKKLEFRDEETWIDEVLGRLGKNEKTNSEEIKIGVNEGKLEEKIDETQEKIGEDVEEKEKNQTKNEIEQVVEEEDMSIITELQLKIPARPENKLTKDDVENYKNLLNNNVLRPYSQKSEDLRNILAYLLQINGWGSVVLKDSMFRDFLGKYENWTRENEKLVEKKLTQIHPGKWKLQTKNLAKLNLFVEIFFKDEVKKLALNHKELQKIFDENSELIVNLKNLEATLLLNRVDSDSVKSRMNQGDIELDNGIKYSILYILNKCEKMFENGTMNDRFCESCKKVIEFLLEYKNWFIGDNGEGKIETPDDETLLNFLSNLFQNGVLDEEYDNIRELIYRKGEFEVEKNEFKENEKFINELKQRNKGIENEFKDLKVTTDIESNFKKVKYNLSRIIVEIFKRKQKIDNVLSEYKSHFMDENGDVKENFGIEDAKKFIDYLFSNLLIDESTAKNLVKLLYVNKILGLNNEEMDDDEKKYIINYIFGRGNQCFRIVFNGGFIPEIRTNSEWNRYKNLESVLEKLGFVCISKMERNQPQKESNTVQIGKTYKKEENAIDGRNSENKNQVTVFEKESKIIEKLKNSENKIDEFRNFIKKLDGEVVGGENKKTKLEEIDELNKKFPGALDAYIEECIQKGNFSFNSCSPFKKGKTGEGGFDFSIVQAGILYKIIDVCGNTDEDLKKIFKHLGFFIRRQFKFEDLGVSNFETWIKNIMHTIIKQSYENRMGCFSGEYWNSGDKWHKIDLQKLSIINMKKTKNKFAIGKGNQDYRIGLVGRDGYYVLFKYFSQHDDYSSNNNTGWLYQKNMKDERKSFVEETGMKLE